MNLTIDSSRRGTRASNSSKKITHGAEARARAKTCLTAFSLSPTYYLSAPSEIFGEKTYLVQKFRSLDTDEIRPTLIRDRLRQ
jgi:hypothetical protein